MKLGDWKEIEILSEDDDRIALITEGGDCPVISKDGYLVRLVPKEEDE